MSTRCSSTRGPASEPSLVTWPTNTSGTSRAFATAASRCAHTDLRDRACRGRQLWISHCLYGVDDDECRRHLVDMLCDRRDVTLGHRPHVVVQDIGAGGTRPEVGAVTLRPTRRAPAGPRRRRPRSATGASTCRCRAHRRGATPTPRRTAAEHAVDLGQTCRNRHEPGTVDCRDRLPGRADVDADSDGCSDTAAADSTSSTSVFHSPHALHRPPHWGLPCPHSRHTNTLRGLAMAPPYAGGETVRFEGVRS